MTHHAEPNLQDARTVIELFRRAARANLDTPGRSGCVVDLPSQGRVTITGDLHDNTDFFKRVCKLARINYSTHYHAVFQEVIHGDSLFNGNDLSYRLLARIAAMKAERPAQVHQVLSNHEMCQLTGDGILKDSVSVVDAFHNGLQFVFGDRWLEVDEAMRDYIRTMPLAVRCANGLFIAHSLPAPRNREAFDPKLLGREMTDADRAGPNGCAHMMVWGRGLAQTVADDLAAAWGARVFVLGHQYVEMGWESVGQTMLILNSDHAHGVALPVDLSKKYTRDELIPLVVPLNSVELIHAGV